MKWLELHIIIAELSGLKNVNYRFYAVVWFVVLDLKRI